MSEWMDLYPRAQIQPRWRETAGGSLQSAVQNNWVVIEECGGWEWGGPHPRWRTEQVIGAPGPCGVGIRQLSDRSRGDTERVPSVPGPSSLAAAAAVPAG